MEIYERNLEEFPPHFFVKIFHLMYFSFFYWKHMYNFVMNEVKLFKNEMHLKFSGGFSS